MELAEFEPVLDKAVTLEVEGETHTLGNVLRDVMWVHPHVELASYTQEHPSKEEILLRCQTSGLISGEQAMAEALQMTKDMLAQIEDAMTIAVQKFEAQQGGAAVGAETAGGGQEEEEEGAV